MGRPLVVSGLDACKMVSSFGYQAYNVYHPSSFTIDDEMKLRYASIWLLKYFRYYRKCKSIARGFVQSDKDGLVVSDEDFASISVGNEMKRKLILITDIVRTSFIKTPLLSVLESKMNRSMLGMIKGCDRVIIPNYGDDKDNISHVGPIVRNLTTPNRSELRKRLGMNKKTIVVSIGGTDSGRYLINKVILIHRKLRKRLDTDLVVVSGPSMKIIASINDFRNVGLVENLHEYIYASDLLISLAGKSTIDESCVYGTPGIFIPIKNHFEQEENARLMGYKYEDIFKLESLIEDRITTIKDRPSINADQNGAQKAATIIAKFSK
jgi:UDP-N-acetylglucosamine--N-acetylmuramyl-(pentapeptide) pyrophosphoryl-undecaprenol N-acetylglucosamine transferase